jgi:hypothetical protein
MKIFGLVAIIFCVAAGIMDLVFLIMFGDLFFLFLAVIMAVLVVSNVLSYRNIAPTSNYRKVGKK